MDEVAPAPGWPARRHTDGGYAAPPTDPTGPTGPTDPAAPAIRACPDAEPDPGRAAAITALLREFQRLARAAQAAGLSSAEMTARFVRANEDLHAPPSEPASAP